MKKNIIDFELFWNILGKLAIFGAVVQFLGFISSTLTVLPEMFSKYLLRNTLILWLIIVCLLIYLWYRPRLLLRKQERTGVLDSELENLKNYLDDINSNLKQSLSVSQDTLNTFNYIFMRLSTTNLGVESLQTGFQSLRSRSEIIQNWFDLYFHGYRRFHKHGAKEFLLFKISELNRILQSVDCQIIPDLIQLRNKLIKFKDLEENYCVLRDEYNNSVTEYTKFLNRAVKKYGSVVSTIKPSRLPN